MNGSGTRKHAYKRGLDHRTEKPDIYEPVIEEYDDPMQSANPINARYALSRNQVASERKYQLTPGMNGFNYDAPYYRRRLQKRFSRIKVGGK